MTSKITIENIHEEFFKACQHSDLITMENLLNHFEQSAIKISNNDFELLKLIESKNKKFLEYVLLKRVNNEGRIQKENYYIDATTYYCILSSKNQRDENLALSMLINANEYLDIIPKEMKTPKFLKKLATLFYQRNIFDFDFNYTKPYAQFLINYVAKGNVFSNKIKLSEDLLYDRNFILKISKYQCNLFSLVSHIYGNDIEIMTNIAINENKVFKYMSFKVKNKISENENIALKLINNDVHNYLHLNKKMQINENCIEKVLTIKPNIYESFLPELKNDCFKNKNYLTRFNIDVKFLSETLKVDKTIAKIMIEKNGNSLDYFPLFKEDSELLIIALKTSKRLSLIPENKRTDEKVKEIILQANLEENSYNINYIPKSVKEDREFILQLVKQEKLFKEDLFPLVNDYGNHRKDYEIVKECIQKYNDLYSRFSHFKEDYEMIHIYIEGMKKQTKGIYSLSIIPQKIKAEASMRKIGVDKYVFNKTLEKKSLEWGKSLQNSKTKKLKI